MADVIVLDDPLRDFPLTDAEKEELLRWYEEIKAARERTANNPDGERP